MLACARLGAPHTVVFGGFSADSLVGPAERHGLRGADHAGRGVARSGSPVPLKRNAGRGAGAVAEREAASIVAAPHRQRRADDRRDATRWWHELVAERATTRRPARASRWTPRICSTCSYTTRDDREAEGDRAHDAPATSSAWRRRTTTSSTSSRTRVYWCAADVGWVTGPQLHRLRAAVQRRRPASCTRGRPTSRQGSLVGDRRALQGRHPLHGADGDPRAHEVGPEHADKHDLSSLAAARVGRRADQPRGVGLVPRA